MSIIYVHLIMRRSSKFYFNISNILTFLFLYLIFLIRSIISFLFHLLHTLIFILIFFNKNINLLLSFATKISNILKF